MSGAITPLPHTPSWSRLGKLCPFFFTILENLREVKTTLKFRYSGLGYRVDLWVVAVVSEESVPSALTIQRYGSITRWCRCSEQHNMSQEHVAFCIEQVSTSTVSKHGADVTKRQLQL